MLYLGVKKSPRQKLTEDVKVNQPCRVALPHLPLLAMGTVGVMGWCEQITARRFVVSVSLAVSLKEGPFASSCATASCAILTAELTMRRRASTSASACCFTSMTCAISGAYDKSTSSKLVMHAPVIVDFSWSTLMSSAEIV